MRKEKLYELNELTEEQCKSRYEVAKMFLPISSLMPLAFGVMNFPFLELSTVIPLMNYMYYNKMKRQLKKYEMFEMNEGEPFIYLGGDIKIPFNYLKRHLLLLGTTGSGKTTLIRKLLYSVMMLGGGATFVDGKADTTDTYEVFCQLVEECGRQDDFLVLNFLNPFQSNSFNPLLYGDDDFCTELCAVFLPETGGDGNASYFKERGMALLRALMAILVWERDKLGKLFTFWDIKQMLTFESVIKLAQRVENGEIPGADEYGKPIGMRLISYLNELGEWRAVLRDAQGDKNADNNMMSSPVVSEAIRQHNFAVQQWSSTFDLLGGAYSPIFSAKKSDIDMMDVVKNSRILYVLLPSLGKSETTLRQMGKMILASVKVTLNELLGKDVVGDADEIKRSTREKRPKLPHIAILDEYGSYAVEGFSTVLAQARSLNYCVCISAQELGRLYKNQAEGEALVANTNLKIFMKIEDKKTAEVAIERVGKEWRYIPSGFKKGYSMGLFEVYNTDGYSIQERDKIRIMDLTKFRPGEAVIIFEDKIKKFRVPYMKGKPVKKLGLLKPISIEAVDIKKKKEKGLKIDEGIYRTWEGLIEGNKLIEAIDYEIYYVMVMIFKKNVLNALILESDEITDEIMIDYIETRDRYIEEFMSISERNSSWLVRESETSRMIENDIRELISWQGVN